MHIKLRHNNQDFSADLSKPIDISLAVANITRAWYIEPPKYEAVRLGENWVGSIAQGGNVNFFNVSFNPHAHGTHTECLGHVTKAHESVNQALEKFWFVAELISVTPEKQGNDLVLTKDGIAAHFKNKPLPEALILRTLPNDVAKINTNFSNQNWPFLAVDAAKFLCENGVNHLIIDQPSVDQEEDGGALAAHKAFWNLPHSPRKNATITELIFVPDTVKDGLYLLNLQVAPVENDASPSRPILFETN